MVVENDAEEEADEAERVVRLVASHIHQDVTAFSPIVSAELPGNGERFEGVIPPVVTAPCFSIRKGAVSVFSLDDYVDAQTMTATQAEALSYAVLSRQNILIVGGTSSGKTTLANALLVIVADTGERVVILEDTRELQCEADDTIALRTHGKNVKLSDLVRSTLRLRPDRIIVGEVRGPEALDMLKAWNTGHPGGIATIHANSAIAGLSRLEQLILEGVTQTVTKVDALVRDMDEFCEWKLGRSPFPPMEKNLPGDLIMTQTTLLHPKDVPADFRAPD